MHPDIVLSLCLRTYWEDTTIVMKVMTATCREHTDSEIAAAYEDEIFAEG